MEEPAPSTEQIRETLEEVASALTEDLAELFGHREVQASIQGADRLVLELSGPHGSLRVAWPPGSGMVEAAGPLGTHGQVALEFLMARETPGAFFPGYRPVAQARRGLVFRELATMLEDSLGTSGFYDDLLVEVRGPVMLIFSEDEHVLVAESGHRRGTGLLDWKVKRLVALAMTAADEELDRGAAGPDG